MLVLEVEEKGRLHAHGALCLQQHQVQLARKALQAAGGTWTSAGAHFQVEMKMMDDPVGWARYISKNLKTLVFEERTNWIGWSLPAKKAAKVFYETVRRWWILSRDDLPIRHSMHFFLGDTSLDRDPHFFAALSQ